MALKTRLNPSLMNSGKGIVYLKNGMDFPPVEESLSDGLLAAGGTLSEERLLSAYSKGIFPWYSDFSPILWYSPPERCIFRPGKFIVSHSLKQKLRQKTFEVTVDRSFDRVISQCASIRRKEEYGTWIVPDMIEAYNALHKAGYAHSVEVWHQGKLAGGLYGVSLGKAFFGESMFHTVTDASKVAIHYLCTRLFSEGFGFIDAQNETPHLLSLGAEVISRGAYLQLLEQALKSPTRKGKWETHPL